MSGVLKAIWDHLRFELIGAGVGLFVLFLRKKFFNNNKGVSMDIVKKEFLEGVKLVIEIKEGELLIGASAKLANLVQLADDKIENKLVSAGLQLLKGYVAQVGK